MVGSPIRAAIMPPMNTVGEPMAMASGGPVQTHMSLTRAAGMPPMITVGQHGGKIGPPTCGTGPVNMGQVCISVIRAAGGINDAPIPGLRQNSWTNFLDKLLNKFLGAYGTQSMLPRPFAE